MCPLPKTAWGVTRAPRAEVLGFSAIQLPRRGAPDQLGLDDLDRLGIVSHPVAGIDNDLPGSTLEQSALGYLHANCAHCHNQARPPRAADALRCFDPERPFSFALRIGELGHVDQTATYRTVRGNMIAPGDVEGSVVIMRVRSRDEWWGMPALGTETVDAEGVALLEQWISKMK